MKEFLMTVMNANLFVIVLFICLAISHMFDLLKLSKNTKRPFFFKLAFAFISKASSGLLIQKFSGYEI